MKHILFVALLLIGSNSHAEDELFSYIGWMRDGDSDNNIFELGAVEPINHYSFFSGSLMYYEYKEHYSYGINASVNLSIGTAVKPYIGIGGFINDYQGCEENDKFENQQNCVSDIRGGVYPEVGIQMTLDGFKIGAYSRLYITSDDEIGMFGLFIGYNIISTGSRYY